MHITIMALRSAALNVASSDPDEHLRLQHHRSWLARRPIRQRLRELKDAAGSGIAACTNTQRPSSNSNLHQRLESTPEHALAVERHLLGIHHRGETWVFHHGGIDAIALRA